MMGRRSHLHSPRSPLRVHLPLLPQLVLVSVLPVTEELMWMDLFMMLNSAFCGLALVQSAICIML